MEDLSEATLDRAQFGGRCATQLPASASVGGALFALLFANVHAGKFRVFIYELVLESPGD